LELLTLYEENSMSHQKKLRFWTILIVLMLTTGQGLSACSSGLRNAKCIPITYPDKQKAKLESYLVQPYDVTDSFEEVIDFYNQNLEPVSLFPGPEQGQWQIEHIDDTQVLYDCFSILNAFEVERGCIYVREDEQNTIIEIVWYLSGTAAPPCDRDLSIIR
jgi:hypothetical protein